MLSLTALYVSAYSVTADLRSSKGAPIQPNMDVFKSPFLSWMPYALGVMVVILLIITAVVLPQLILDAIGSWNDRRKSAKAIRGHCCTKQCRH